MKNKERKEEREGAEREGGRKRGRKRQTKSQIFTGVNLARFRVKSDYPDAANGVDTGFTRDARDLSYNSSQQEQGIVSVCNVSNAVCVCQMKITSKLYCQCVIELK